MDPLMKEQDFFIHDSITFSKGIELVTKLKDTYSILQKSKEASSFNKFSQFEPPNFLCKKISCFAWGSYNGCFKEHDSPKKLGGEAGER